MAHYCKPPGVANATGYDVDGKLAPDSIWRMQVPTGVTKEVALWGGKDLWVKSNNPGILFEDTPPFRMVGDLKVLSLRGKRPGTTLLDAGLGASFWISLQIQVFGAEIAAD